MKKILLLLVCVMASMTTMGLKAQDGAKTLSQGQWKHGLAVGAQWIATDLGFAQAEEKVIARTNENYSLDDLRVLYGSKAKWVTYYDKLKAHENETGDMEKLLSTIAAEYEKGAVLKGGVRRDVEKYNATHTGDEVGATPAGEPAPAAAVNAPTTVTNASDSTANQEQKAEQKEESEGSHSGHGWLYLLTILGLAAGAIGTFLAMQARNENQAIARDLNDDIANMQKQIDKLRGIIKNGKVEETNKPVKHTHKLNEVDGLAQTKKIEFDEKPAPKNENKRPEPKHEPKREEPKRQEPKVEKKVEAPKREEPKATVLGEPRILFMAKPDEADNFSRSSSQYEPGNSIFELTTMDGKSGSFTVINKSDVHKLALLMPGDTLTRACSGNNIQSSAGKSRIVTDRAGRAQLENGKWHIVVKAIIHYE